MKLNHRLLIPAVLIVIVLFALLGCSQSNSQVASPRFNDAAQGISGPQALASSSDTVAAQPVLIGFKNVPGVSGQSIVTAAGGKVKYAYHRIPVVAASLSPSAIDNLLKNPNVAYIEPDAQAHATVETTPWGITKVNAPQVWGLNYFGAGVKVAVLDTGIDYNHPDLSPVYSGGYDFVNNDSYPMDDHGHGTHVSGTIAAVANSFGVVGAAPGVSLYGVKVLDSGGSGFYSDIIAGIQWSIDNQIKVVNMSLGGNYGSTSLEVICNSAYNAGVLVVAAAGNDGRANGSGDTVDYPGRYSSVLAVAATDSSDKRASFSSTGPALDLSAPGVNVLSDIPGSATGIKSGTSMATPHVSGCAALVFSSGNYTNQQVWDRLTTTAKDLGATGFDTLYGYGLVDAYAAVTGTPPPPPPDHGTLTGTVTNSSTGRNIRSALVSVDSGQSGTTNSKGKYTIGNIPSGSHQVTASATGYQSKTLTVEILANQTVTLNFQLTPL